VDLDKYYESILVKVKKISINFLIHSNCIFWYHEI